MQHCTSGMHFAALVSGYICGGFHANRLLGSDTQPKAAAARHGLRAGQRQR
jgi:hypothetical protein